jgi:hypothetical protein
MKNVMMMLVSLLWAALWFTFCQNIEGEYSLNVLAMMCIGAIMVWGLLIAAVEYIYSNKVERRNALTKW